MTFIDGDSRDQVSLLPACIDDYVAPDSLVRVLDAFVASLDLAELGFNRAVAAATGRPGFQPGDMLRLCIWGYLNQVRSSRHLERACVRDLEALWLMRRLPPDYRTIAAFFGTVAVDIALDVEQGVNALHGLQWRSGAAQTGCPLQPRYDLPVLEGGVVVHDGMHQLACGHLGLNGIEKSE